MEQSQKKFKKKRYLFLFLLIACYFFVVKTLQCSLFLCIGFYELNGNDTSTIAQVK